MHRDGAAARRPSFEWLEDRSLLSGNFPMQAGPQLDFAGSGRSLLHGLGHASSGAWNDNTGTLQGAWDRSGAGFGRSQDAWNGSAWSTGNAQSWQTGNESSESSGGSRSGQKGTPGSSLRQGGRSPSEPSLSASPTVAANSGGGSGNGTSNVAPAMPNEPTSTESAGNGPQASGIPAAPPITPAANISEVGLEAAGGASTALPGSAQLPTLLVAVGPPATTSATNARLASQADTAEAGVESWPSPDHAARPAPAWSASLRAVWEGATGQHKAPFTNDAAASFFPASADLIAAVVPFDRDAIERAIDRFIDELDGGTTRAAIKRGPTRLILLSMALAGGALALEELRRHWRRECGARLSARDRESQNALVAFPELPGSWSSRLS
jgi:hypothetical protein